MEGEEDFSSLEVKRTSERVWTARSAVQAKPSEAASNQISYENRSSLNITLTPYHNSYTD
jgi:hypothetical protein